jgi:hypothetical protein
MLTAEFLERVVSDIARADYPVREKVVRLFAITQIAYRQPPGNHAWGELRKLAGEQYCDALALLTGYCIGLADRNRSHGVWTELVPELNTENNR